MKVPDVAVKAVHNTLVVKGAITFGIVAYYVLPPGWDAGCVLAANMLWLWRF